MIRKSTQTTTQQYNKETKQQLYHDGVISSGDECDEEWQHHVDEEGNEGVKVDLAEGPHQRAAVLHLSECYKHVVSIDQRKQALWHHGQGAKLDTWSPS